MRSFVLYIFLLPLLSIAQEPAHEIIIDEKLESLTIYSLLQDERANIWISSSSGLFRYNGYETKEYFSKDLVSASLFGLVQDHNQKIYCHNTSGQIFQVRGDSLQLYYTVPDSLYNNFFYFDFDNKNNLIISGKGFYSIDQNKRITTLIYHTNLSATPIARKKNQALEFYSSSGNDLFSLYNNKLIQEHTTIDFGNKHFYYPLYSDNNEYLGDGRSSHLYKRNGSNFERIDHGIDFETGCKVFVDKEDDIWILRNQRGLYLHSQNETDSRYHNRLLFPSYTISSNLEDRDGNIWLGTFGKGIIKISNKENQIFNNTSLDGNNELSSISKDLDNNLYIGSINGDIYQYDNSDLLKIDHVPGRIDNIEYNPNSRDFYFNYFAFHPSKGIYQQTPFGSVKNISNTKAGSSIISSYVGIYIQCKEKYLKDLESLGFKKEDQFGLSLTTGRLQCATYDEAAKTLWIGESSKLKQVTKNGEREFKLNGKSVIALDMLWIDQQLFIATLRDGIIIVRDGQVQDNITVKNGLLSNSIKELKLHDNKLFIGSKHGLQELDLTTFALRSFQNANGVTLKVIDFEIVGNTAYIIHHRGLQMIHLNEKLKQVQPPILDFTSIRVNGKEKKASQKLSLRYNQNVIEFNFAAKTYNNREQLTYHYQLVGLDNEWTTLNYLNNQVNFSGLEHGSYILHVYAKDANGQKSNVIQYEFNVEQPIWMAWWFYLGISVLAIVLVILFYKKRFQIQQKKAEQINELNASKLTAIQSQMNPHFIFNSLNSIQDLVIQGDTENSYTFITKFANLIRKTLNYSDKDFIDFEQEIQLLELYLGLEKLRFKDDFDFEIDTDDIADIYIPPMLIQPFIENALVHGLLHKEGHKQLSVSFELNEHLSCTIIDNGVGREKAKEIKQRQKGNHESFAVQAIKKRFNILREKFNGDIGFKYKDLLENGVIRGTKVVIHIPIKRQF